MNVLQIPMSDTAPWFEQQIQLTGTMYTLEFYFNVRGMCWVMSISDAASNLIVSQIPLLIGRDLTATYSDARLPKGYFVCFDMTGKGQQPALASFNTTHKLFFVEQ